MSNNTVGCLGTIALLGLIAGIMSAFEKCSGPEERDGFAGPIPVRFQGAYNSYSCEGVHLDGLVTVGGDDINYGGAKFDVTGVVSESQNSVTLRGEPVAANGRETAETFTITYTPVGGMADLDGSEYERCSQY